MKAIVLQGPCAPEELRVTEAPMPALGERDALIRIGAAGVCSHDIAVRNGTLKRGVHWPIIPGHEIAGTIEAVGRLVKTFKVGDRVATTQRRYICGVCNLCRTARETSCEEREFLGDSGMYGGYAEYVAVDELNLAHLPDGISFTDAAVTACAIGTEVNAIRDVGKVRMGERVLITGASGGLGVHGIQLAKVAGAEVFAVTSTEQKAAMLRQLGVDHVIVAKHGEDFSPALREATRGQGIDVVIDNVGGSVFQPVRRSLAIGARWVLVGQLTGEFISLNLAQIFTRDISLLSVRSTSRAQLDDTLALVAAGKVKPVIADILPLEKAGEAHRRVESSGVVGRIVLTPQ